MIERIWNFIKRHKKKVILTGIATWGGIYLFRYVRRKFREFQEIESAECLAQARRQHHFDSNQRTCNITVLSMLPKLREVVIHLLNTEECTEQLKSLVLPQNKTGDIKSPTAMQGVTKIHSFQQAADLGGVKDFETLDQVINFERDFEKAKKGETSEILYQIVTGLRSDLTGAQQQPALLANDTAAGKDRDGEASDTEEEEGEEDDDDSDDETDENSDDGSESDPEKQDDKSKPFLDRQRHESPNSKKERKKLVKEAQREKRKNKVPKHLKRKKDKIGRQGKKK